MSVQNIIDVVYQVLSCLGILSVIGFLYVFENWYIKTKNKLIEETDESKVRMVDDIILTVVNHLNQTMVDELKKKKIFGEEEQEKVKEIALENIKNLISDDCVNAVENVYNDFEQYIELKLEEIVKQEKYEE